MKLFSPLPGLLHHVAGTDDAAAAHVAAALPSPADVLQDCDTADDSAAPTVPEAAAAQAEAEASAAAESVRAATLQRLQDIKRRLEQVRDGTRTGLLNLHPTPYRNGQCQPLKTM